MTPLDLALIALDDGLKPYQAALGTDLVAYRNHCARVLHAFDSLVSDETAMRQAAVATIYHDLGIWTHGTLDYLDPSADLARDALVEMGEPGWVDPVVAMVVWHHKLRPYTGPHADVAEPYRQADSADVMLGLVRYGIDGEVLRAGRARFANAGFHKRLMQLGGRRFLRKPWSPLPMFRW